MSSSSLATQPLGAFSLKPCHICAGLHDYRLQRGTMVAASAASAPCSSSVPPPPKTTLSPTELTN
jgi:hypothetical protein